MQGRWHTRFGRWVHHYGVVRLAHDVGAGCYGVSLTPEAVYQWVGGQRAPRPAHASRIVALSQGRVSWDDIYGQRAHAAPHAAP